jgi:hypothetical protein
MIAEIMSPMTLPSLSSLSADGSKYCIRNALSVLFAEFSLAETRENNKDGKRKGNYWHPMLNVEAKNRKISDKPIKKRFLHPDELTHQGTAIK